MLFGIYLFSNMVSIMTWFDADSKLPDEGDVVIYLRPPFAALAFRIENYWFFIETKGFVQTKPKVWGSINFPKGMNVGLIFHTERGELSLSELSRFHPELYDEQVTKIMAHYGVYCQLPPKKRGGQLKLDTDKLTLLSKYLNQNKTKNEIAKMLNVSRSTLYRYIDKLK